MIKAPMSAELPGYIHDLHSGISEFLKNGAYQIPNVGDSKSLIAYTDYGGEHAKATEWTYSGLFCGWNLIGDWDLARKEIRRMSLPDGRRMSFKDLDDRYRQECLGDWLEAGEKLPALLVQVSISKGLGSIHGPKSREAIQSMSDLLLKNTGTYWKPEVAEKVARIGMFTAYFLSLLARDGQEVGWFSDDDAIMANMSQKQGMGKVLQSLMQRMCSNRLGGLGYGVPPADDFELVMEDLLSYPDMVCGAVGDYFSTTSAANNPAIYQPHSKAILRWFASNGPRMCKWSFRLKPCADGKITLSKVLWEAQAD